MDTLKNLTSTITDLIHTWGLFLTMFFFPGLFLMSNTITQSANAVASDQLPQSDTYAFLSENHPISTKTKPQLSLITPVVLEKKRKNSASTAAVNSPGITISSTDPEGIRASKGTYGHCVRIEWARIPDAVGYIIKRKLKDRNGDWVEIGNIAHTNIYMDNTAEIDAEYEYKIEAIGIDSKILDEKTDYGYRKSPNDESPPTVNPPVTKSISAVSASEVELSWEKVDKATHYRIQVFACREINNSRQKKLILVTDTLLSEDRLNYTIKDIESLSICAWRIRWEDSRHYSRYTDIMPVKMDVEESLNNFTLEFQILRDLLINANKSNNEIYKENVVAGDEQETIILERQGEDFLFQYSSSDHDKDTRVFRKSISKFGCSKENDLKARYESLLYDSICINDDSEKIFIRLLYAKDTPANTPVWIYLNEDSVPRASFMPVITFSKNEKATFQWSPPIYLGRLDKDCYDLKMITAGQDRGVMDLDKFQIFFRKITSKERE